MRFIVALILLTFPIRLMAECICSDVPDIKTAISTASNIFKGRVEQSISINPFDRLVKVYVYKSWKSAKADHVWLATTSLDKECGVNFITGHEYLIYAYNLTNNLLSASKCGRTKPWPDVSYQEEVSLGEVIFINEME